MILADLLTHCCAVGQEINDQPDCLVTRGPAVEGHVGRIRDGVARPSLRSILLSSCARIDDSHQVEPFLIGIFFGYVGSICHSVSKLKHGLFGVEEKAVDFSRPRVFAPFCLI